MTALYAVIGTGGFGREGMELARCNCRERHGSESDYRLCFVEHEVRTRVIDGVEVLSFAEFTRLEAGEKFFNVLIADVRIRQRIATECERLGMRPFTIRSASAEVHSTARIADGAVLCQFTFVSANARVGRHFHLNHHGYVSHDCTIGDFVTFAPGVGCNGTIVIEDLAYVGSGVVIRQGTPTRSMRIGARATIGMGAVVLDSVPSDATVIGNPARVLRK